MEVFTNVPTVATPAAVLIASAGNKNQRGSSSTMDQVMESRTLFLL